MYRSPEIGHDILLAWPLGKSDMRYDDTLGRKSQSSDHMAAPYMNSTMVIYRRVGRGGEKASQRT
jgi:hypothetical protein